MAKRQLTEQEKSLTLRNLGRAKDELAYIDAMVKQKRLAIEIAPLVYKQQVRTMEAELVKWEQQMQEAQFTIEIAEKQIAEGVETDKKEKIRR